MMENLTEKLRGHARHQADGVTLIKRRSCLTRFPVADSAEKNVSQEKGEKVNALIDADRRVEKRINQRSLK